MNLTALIAAVERRSGVAYDSTATTEVINEAIQSISNERDWGWLESVWLPTADATDDFSLPAGTRKVRSVTVGGFLYPQLSVQAVDDDSFETGWLVEAEELVIRPAPAVGQVITVRTFIDEPVLVAGGDTPLLPARYHQGLVNYAAAIALERTDESRRADVCMAAYDRTLRQMRSGAERATGPRRVRVRPGSML